MSQISAKLVAELRAQTGVGLMDCKKALLEAAGDAEEAIAILRKKGVATAAKKAGRDASEGVVESYIHLGGKVGVLLELKCETDFVAKNDAFKGLARDIAMHVAAASPLYVSREDVPEDVVEKEREIAASQAEGKPAQAIQKIVEGKLDKYFSTICLLEQPFVKNPDQSIKDLLTENVSKMGENLIIGRFARFQLGE
tara:strand:+ start:7596 stop:8186 length:591 start_codon:yes stop_codon:yes gene_type:complete